ncbi:PKD domain-containing protein [candidate division WOR-3 bacterium]|nr:PKD domain-containing protein [candidate division WOR-3 bacterium]
MLTENAFLAIAAGLMLPLTSLAQPPTAVEFTVPDYVSTKQGALDYVTISGGELLRVPDKPLVPIYSKSVDYPKGYRVQDVVLKDRSGLKSDSGLILPLVRPFAPPGAADTGSWYPKEEFAWRLWDNPDGSTSLVITSYPLYYNGRTSRVRFYRNYRFGVKYVYSDLSFTRAQTDQPAYEPGSTVFISAAVRNEGRPQDITLDVSLERLVGNVPAVRLPAKTVKKMSGDTTVTAAWPSQNAAPGDYRARVTLKDGAGNVIGTRDLEFSLGVSSGEVRDFAATPQSLRIGDVVRLALDFVNTGSRSLSGECVFRLTGPDGTLKQSTHPLAELSPGSTTSFSDTWSTTAAKKAVDYYALAYVTFSGGSASTEPVRLSTNQLPQATFTVVPPEPVAGADVTFGASGSTDPDGKVKSYRWQFGDGAEARGARARHRFELPGTYEVKLTVTDNEGGTGTRAQSLSVGE